MQKLITGGSTILIFISICGPLKAAFHSPQVESRSNKVVATTPTLSPDMLLASTTLTPDATQQSTVTPVPVSTSTPEPLKIRVVKHQESQFRKGAIGQAQLSIINKAINSIIWSRNANPKVAADEDYAAIVKECEGSGVHDLLTDLITEAVSNDYQPNHKAANVTYSTQLNSDFENGHQSDNSNGKSTGEMAAGRGTGVDSGLTPAGRQPDLTANATSSSPAQSPPSAKAIHSKTGYIKHRSTVGHRTVDVKLRLIALWHQSLARPEKAIK